MGVLLKVATWTLNALPRPVSLRLAKLIGTLLYINAQRTHFRGSIERNIEIAFPDRFSDRERQEMARRHAQDIMTTLVELARVRELPKLLERGIVVLEGKERLDRALEQGKGAIILGAHLGNWELFFAAFGLLGYDATAVVARQPNDLVNRWLVNARSRFGTRIVYYDAIKSRDVEQILAKGGLVILLADQHNYGGAARNIVPFFGRPVSVPGGPIAYAIRYGAPLVPAYTIRLPGDRHRIVFESPMELIDPNQPDYFQANCHKMIQRFERWIRTHPTQWMWSNNRWAWLDKDLRPRTS